MSYKRSTSVPFSNNRSHWSSASTWCGLLALDRTMDPAVLVYWWVRAASVWRRTRKSVWMTGRTGHLHKMTHLLLLNRTKRTSYRPNTHFHPRLLTSTLGLYSNAGRSCFLFSLLHGKNRAPLESFLFFNQTLSPGTGTNVLFFVVIHSFFHCFGCALKCQQKQGRDSCAKVDFTRQS